MSMWNVPVLMHVWSRQQTNNFYIKNQRHLIYLVADKDQQGAINTMQDKSNDSFLLCRYSVVLF